jgi:hypothetical protein
MTFKQIWEANSIETALTATTTMVNYMPTPRPWQMFRPQVTANYIGWWMAHDRQNVNCSIGCATPKHSFWKNMILLPFANNAYTVSTM